MKILKKDIDKKINESVPFNAGRYIDSIINPKKKDCLFIPISKNTNEVIIYLNKKDWIDISIEAGIKDVRQQLFYNTSIIVTEHIKENKFLIQINNNIKNDMEFIYADFGVCLATICQCP